MILFIADIGSNHNQNRDRAIALIVKAKEVGADAVKCQLFHPDKLYAPIEQNAKKIELIRSWALPPEWIPDIANKCHTLELQFGCTPFDLESVNRLMDIVDFYKISSYDILRLDLIERCTNHASLTNASILLSTGVSTSEEIRNAYGAARRFVPDKRITLMHCVSNYPAKPEECCLSHISMYKHLYKCLVGWSDHTASPGVIYRAVMRGASTVEFHLDLEDMAGNETRFGHCWHPADIKRVIDNIRTGDAADIGPCQADAGHREERADPEDGLRPMKGAREVND